MSQKEIIEFVKWLSLNYKDVDSFTWKHKQTEKLRGIRSIVKEYVRDKKLQKEKSTTG